MVRGADGGGAAVRGGLDADVGCAGEQRRLQRRRAVAWAAHDQALDGGRDHKQGCCEEPHLAVGWASGRSWSRDETNAWLQAARRPQFDHLIRVSALIPYCPLAWIWIYWIWIYWPVESSQHRRRADGLRGGDKGSNVGAAARIKSARPSCGRSGRRNRACRLLARP